MTSPVDAAPTWASVVLAAGKGTRMRSQLPKVLHPIAGRAMVLHILDALNTAGFNDPLVVVGHAASQVRAAIADAAATVEQAEQLGTGHAVQQALPMLESSGHRQVIVVNGDMPLLQAATLLALMLRHAAGSGVMTIATCTVHDPRGLGRIARTPTGALRAIVEEAEAAPAEAAITEINAGIYAFDVDWLSAQIPNLPRRKGGEYYLTDLVAIALHQGKTVATLTLSNPAEALGVNDRVQLSQAEGVLRQRIRERHMLAGVTMLDPASTFIDAAVTIGEDTTLLPNTLISGATAIGRDCTIGPGARLRDATVGDGVSIGGSTLEECTVESGAGIGPYCHLRPGAYVESGVHLGNYVELKNTRVRSGSQVGHFSYLGDADIGRDVNIGAGTITCNYDGEHKHRTVIGDGAFIGSDTMLIAPVTIGPGAYTATGAVVTRDVPPGGTVAGVPARPFERRQRPPLT